MIRTQDRAWFVRVSDIEWVEAADYNVRIHTSAQTYTTRETLSGLAEQLDPRRFVRVHRSTIVNIDRVREIQPYFHGAYILCSRTAPRSDSAVRGATPSGGAGPDPLIGRSRPCIRR